MRDYIILNGVNSNTITGLLISTLPPITKPKKRTQIEEIDGRDGDIVTTLGYSAYDKELEIGLYGDFDIDDVIAYFNSEGTVTFSNEPDKFYNYQILDQIDYEKLIRFKKAKIKMHVQPFKYPLEETPVEITVSTVSDEGETIDLDNTEEAPMSLTYKGNTSQSGTPTPDSPQDIHVVSGDNIITIENSDSSESQSYHITLPEGMYMGWIGDYQDNIYKDSDKYYIEKKIGKVVLNGSESWIKGDSNGRFNLNVSDAFLGSASNNPILCTHFQQIFAITNYSIFLSSAYHQFGVIYQDINWDTTTWKTWLSSHNTTVYYALVTPTTTEITDETLIAQLNALANASSYDTKTHITQNANDKPFILNATALQQGSGEATVNNEGNIYSKPTLDIEGSGTVGIYLEGNQIFSIDLSNFSECVIDTTQLEAYNPTTSELMNRQVTGDYSNFKLNAGENQVSTTGEIEKVTISNYTRWL